VLALLLPLSTGNSMQPIGMTAAENLQRFVKEIAPLWSSGTLDACGNSHFTSAKLLCIRFEPMLP
jgi:hypothetical protein